MKTDMWTLFNAKKADVYRAFPTSRRFLDTGFDLDPRSHENGRLALISLNQKIVLDLVSGDLVHL